MNRRELIAGGIAAAVVAPVAAQSDGKYTLSTATMNTVTIPAQVSHEERCKQYAICQQRGHRPTVYGSMHYNSITTLTFKIIPDSAPSPYPNVGEGDWMECWDCKTSYRFVTTMEEKGKP